MTLEEIINKIEGAGYYFELSSYIDYGYGHGILEKGRLEGSVLNKHMEKMYTVDVYTDTDIAIQVKGLLHYVTLMRRLNS